MNQAQEIEDLAASVAVVDLDAQGVESETEEEDKEEYDYAAIGDPEAIELLLLDFEKHKSNTVEMVGRLRKRKPEYMASAKWAKLCTIANDEREEENIWETRSRALGNIGVLYVRTMALMVSKGYTQDGRYVRDEAEPASYQKRPLRINKPQKLDGKYHGFEIGAYNRVWKGIVEELSDRKKHGRAKFASPKKLKQAAVTGLIYKLVYDKLRQRRTDGTLASRSKA